MTATKKSCSLLLIFLVASNLLSIQMASAMAKPSTPESFTMRYVDYSYNVAPTYGTDQYTGKTVIIQDGYHVNNMSIEFTIKNQPFTSYADSSGNQIGLYYNLRHKGANGTEWSYYPFAPNGTTTLRYGGMFGGENPGSPKQLAASNSQYTVISISLRDLSLEAVAVDGQVEFQVQAIAGYMEASDYMLAGYVYAFTGEYNQWSSTQTIGNLKSTLNPSVSPTHNSTSNPIAQAAQSGVNREVDWWKIGAIVLAIMVVFLVVVALFKRRLRKLTVQAVKNG